MEEIKLIALILKRTHARRLVAVFLVTFFAAAALLQLTDPALATYADSLWFCFNVVTTIGLGDYTVTTLAARLVTVLLGLYGILMFALIPALIVSFYLEKVNLAKDQTLTQFYDQLAHADTLTSAQKQEIARKVKKVRP